MSVHLRRLSPIDFLERSARVYRRETAVVDGAVRRTYPEMLERVYRFAHLLHALGVRNGERVALLAKNQTTLLEAHFAVPLAGGVLCALNVRLIASEIAYIVDHCGASVVVYDPEFAPLVEGLAPGVRRVRSGDATAQDLEALLARSSAAPIDNPVTDEDAMISINYTSGTTGRPKGVMYTHRGAYLNALAEIATANLRPESVLPLDASDVPLQRLVLPLGGDRRRRDARVPRQSRSRSDLRTGRARAGHALLRRADRLDRYWRTTRKRGSSRNRFTSSRPGAAPAPTTIAQIEALGATVTQVYGLTETYGPITVSAWQTQWDALPPAERAKLKAAKASA